MLRVVLAWKRSVCVLCSSAVDEPSASADAFQHGLQNLADARPCVLCSSARVGAGAVVLCSSSLASNQAPLIANVLCSNAHGGHLQTERGQPVPNNILPPFVQPSRIEVFEELLVRDAHVDEGVGPLRQKAPPQGRPGACRPSPSRWAFPHASRPPYHWQGRCPLALEAVVRGDPPHVVPPELVAAPLVLASLAVWFAARSLGNLYSCG